MAKSARLNFKMIKREMFSKRSRLVAVSAERYRLCILLPDLRGGGAERVGVNLANEFALRGYSVEMVLRTAKGEFAAELNPAVRIVDLKVSRFRDLLIPFVLYLRDSQPDSLLACMWPLTSIALWGRRLSGARTRVIIAEHAIWSRSELVGSPARRWLIKMTMRRTFSMADGVVTVSQGAANDLSRFASVDRDKISTIYNPVVGSAKSDFSRTADLDGWWFGAHRKILAVGSLKEIKDYPTLLAGFEKLARQIPARLLILGEGECRAALERQIEQLGIGSNVFMPGFVRELSGFYSHADLHVLSSTAEGFGNVIVEALAAGTPVVSTDCPSGPREILCNGRFGRLVPVGDPEALAEAMAASLAETHDSEALKSRANDFSISRAANEYENLLFPR